MFGFNASLLVTKQYGLVVPFQFTAIVVGYFVSLVRYGEQVNWFCVAGTLAITIGIIMLLRNRDQI